jgi:hypothetical protein
MPAVPTHPARCLGCDGKREVPFVCLSEPYGLPCPAVYAACSARACSPALAADLAAVSATRSAAFALLYVQLARNNGSWAVLLSGQLQLRPLSQTSLCRGRCNTSCLFGTLTLLDGHVSQRLAITEQESWAPSDCVVVAHVLVC